MDVFNIWTVPGSPFARAVMATLEEKGLPWRLRPLAPMDSKGPAHLTRNPFGRMPAVEHGDFSLYETQAVMRYIDRLVPTPALTPSDPCAEARMNQLMRQAQKLQGDVQKAQEEMATLTAEGLRGHHLWPGDRAEIRHSSR